MEPQPLTFILVACIQYLWRVKSGKLSFICIIAKADRRPREKKKFYHQFSIVKYSYLPTDTFRKYVERHVTWSKLTLKFTGYCRQTSYTDSTVIHTLVPAVAWELQSQFAPGYMHFSIFFWRCLWDTAPYNCTYTGWLCLKKVSIPLTHTELTNISAVNQKIIHRADLDLEYMTVLLSELPIYCQ